MEVRETRSVTWFEFIDIWSLVTAAVVIIIMCICRFATPLHDLYVPPNDSLSDFPYPGKSTVPTPILYILIFPVAFVLVCGAFFAQRFLPNRLREFNPFTAAWVFATIFGLTAGATDLFKNYVGRPRPDIYARCGYNATYESCRSVIGDDALDEFKSWPSGHASMSMCAFLFDALFVQELVRGRSLAASAVAGFIVFIPLYIGASRIRDFRHHTDDVLAGLFVGTLCTLVVWIRMHKRIFLKVKSGSDETGGTIGGGNLV
jgi:phosphatidate phosphatase